MSESEDRYIWERRGLGRYEILDRSAPQLGPWPPMSESAELSNAVLICQALNEKHNRENNDNKGPDTYDCQTKGCLHPLLRDGYCWYCLNSKERL